MPHIQAHCILSVALMRQVSPPTNRAKLLWHNFMRFTTAGFTSAATAIVAAAAAAEATATPLASSSCHRILASYATCHMPRQATTTTTFPSTWQLVMRAQEHTHREMMPTSTRLPSLLHSIPNHLSPVPVSVPLTFPAQAPFSSFCKCVCI